MGLVSVSKLQVRLVRVVRFTMLESLGVCLFMDFCELTNSDSSSRTQIRTPLLYAPNHLSNPGLGLTLTLTLCRVRVTGLGLAKR